MNQEDLAILARETLAICTQGEYTAPSGRPVPIAAALSGAIEGTVIHAPGDFPDREIKRFGSTAIEVRNESTFCAVARLANSYEHLAVLNFASARNPGGGFLRGTMAQEEALAYASGLYPCLARQSDFYERTRDADSALYLDLAIFSPAVPFFRDDRGHLTESPVFASVITAPAPNASVLAEQDPSALRQLKPVLTRRAQLVLAVGAAHKVDTLILGAWGCGVFANDPRVVAGIFADLLEGDGLYAHAFSRVVFAVLDRSSDRANLAAFKDALGLPA